MIKNINSIQSAIEKATAFLKRKNIESPQITAEILISHVLSISKTELYLKLNDPISKDKFEKFWSLVVARSNNIPIQYLTKEVSFLDLKLFIKEGVFIPRPETEILANKAISILQNIKTNDSLKSSNNKRFLVLDIGTGCGAIALSIAKEVPNCYVYATDISEKALEIAKINTLNLNLSNKIKFIDGYLFEPLPSDLKFSFDLIISNPPYVSVPHYKKLQPEIRKYEPKVALLAGKDGILYHRKIISKSVDYLRKGGYLLLEIGYNQSKQIIEIVENIKTKKVSKDIEIKRVVKGIKNQSQSSFKNKGYEIKEIVKDLSGIDRAIVLKKIR